MRPSTRKNLDSCQTLFLQFCLKYGVEIENPTVDDVGAFTELLTNTDLSFSTIKNYCTAIKTLYAEWGLVHVLRSFDTPAWRFMLKGLAYSATTRQDCRAAMTFIDLKKMTMMCKDDKSLWPLRVALTFGYFGYLRVSNLAPDVALNFDTTRHTTWADVVPSKEGIIVELKWTKTLQARQGTTPIPLAALTDATICPLKAWEDYCELFPGIKDYENTPLLLSTGFDKGKIVTIPKLRAMFHRVANMTGLSAKGYTPHSLRRGEQPSVSNREFLFKI